MSHSSVPAVLIRKLRFLLVPLPFLLTLQLCNYTEFSSVRFKKIVSRLTLSEEMIAKTNTARITSIAFHPGEEKVLVASGSTSGDLGML